MPQPGSSPTVGRRRFDRPKNSSPKPTKLFPWGNALLIGNHNEESDGDFFMIQTFNRMGIGSRNRQRAAALSIVACGFASLAAAKIDVVTLPQRDTTQLTIYRAADLTLVRETRELTFKKGTNQIQFSWANTLIDPTSLQIVMVERAAQFRVLDATYPANSQNTIVWNIDATEEGKARVEISYFASGLSWRADYTAIANDDETLLRVEPDFTITNASGEDFTNAATRLVVGEVNLVETIAQLAQMGIKFQGGEEQARQQLGRKMLVKRESNEGFLDQVSDSAYPASAPVQQKAKEIIKAAVSEYYLYSIEGTESIENGWGKQLPNPRVDGVPIDVSYEYNPHKFGSETVKFYKFKNDVAHKLGETPQPEGNWYVYSGDTRGGLRFQGLFNHKYAPIGEDIELNLGADGLAIVEERQMSMTRTNFEYDHYDNPTGWDVVEVRELEIRNARTRAIPMKMTLTPGYSDWEITEATDAFKQVDRTSVEWKLDAPALGTKVIRYKFTTRVGTRDRNNK